MFLLDAEGQKVDWLVGYEPPPDRFLAKLEKAVRGVDTYRALSDRYAKEPNNPEAAFRLALKYREDLSQKEKAVALFRQVRSADVKATAGQTEVDGFSARASLREFAEYFLAEMGPGAKSAAMRAFLAKYPQSALLKSAYGFLCRFYRGGVRKEEAAEFFEKYAALFPNDLEPLEAYLSYIISNGGLVDKGREIAGRMRALAGGGLSPRQAMVMVSFYADTGDLGSAFAVYGRDMMNPQLSVDPDVLLRCALFWLGQKAHRQEALKMVERALALEPPSPNARQRAAQIYLRAGLKDKALDVYGLSFVSAHENKAVALASYAQFWYRQHINLAGALEAARRSSELDPMAATYDLTAGILFLRKEYAEAL
ncbi:MAG: hypothetical protein OEW05_13650, partial [Candidatus Aminicenantes bacterium]|nr:hypothetical protein [Candidatus Aminicenantes bacterium]